jgi:hypothetical protein
VCVLRSVGLLQRDTHCCTLNVTVRIDAHCCTLNVTVRIDTHCCTLNVTVRIDAQKSVDHNQNYKQNSEFEPQHNVTASYRVFCESFICMEYCNISLAHSDGTVMWHSVGAHSDVAQCQWTYSDVAQCQWTHSDVAQCPISYDLHSFESVKIIKKNSE